MFGSPNPTTLNVHPPQVPIIPTKQQSLEHRIQFFLQPLLVVDIRLLIFTSPDIEAELFIVSYAPDVRVVGGEGMVVVVMVMVIVVMMMMR